MSNPSSTHYLADRVQFYGGSRGDSLVARSTDVPAGERFKYSMAVTAIQANGLPFYRQPIEDFTNVVPNTHDWAMSFWAKASVPMTISSDLGDQASQTHSLTTSWQRFTNIVPAGTAFTYSAFDLQGNSSAGIIYVTGCQLELGSVATDFEHRSYGEELALCQRYYETGNTYRIATGNGESDHQVGYCVTKRSAASISILNTANIHNHTVSATYIGSFYLNGSGGNYSNFWYDWTAEAEL